MGPNARRMMVVAALAAGITLLNSLTIRGTAGQVTFVPDDYPTIQAALDNATEGDTIFVRPGIYSENVVVSTSQVRLRGAGDGVVLDGATLIGVGIHVLGTAAVPVTGVEVMNFEVRNYERGITLEQATEARVSHNYVHDNVEKIAPLNLADGFGIELTSAWASDVSHNIISSNGFGGVRIGGQPRASVDNNVHHNRVLDNGAQAPNFNGGGIFLTGPSNDNRIEYNEITGTLGRGIVINRPANTDPLRGTLIAHNRAHNNQRAGVAIMGSATDNIVEYNDARGNNLLGTGPCWRCNLFDNSSGRNGGNIFRQNLGTYGIPGDACHGPL